MKRLLIRTNVHTPRQVLLSMLFFVSFFDACKKPDNTPLPGSNDAGRYSSEVIDKWISMQVRLERDATGIANVSFERYYAYSGVAAFEALSPGTDVGRSTSAKWNELSGLPKPDRGTKYYWPASVNASLAFMNRNIFKTASDLNKAAIDSLEKALNAIYLSAENEETVLRSNAFGKAVAVAVFNWSETDGYKDDADPFTLATTPGSWIPTPPGFAIASTPYFGNNRNMIAGSTDNSQPGAPIAYSEDPASPFYLMVKQVYDASQNLTADQTATALFWRDVPGVTTAGHWLSILQQVLQQTGTRLDNAAYSYAITGVCQNDASISCWQTKYKYSLIRPISYIRSVMKFTSWNSLLTTPAHPEYSSAHAVISASAAAALAALFGNIGNFTDHTYDYLNFAPRTYNSFTAIATEAGISRMYAGIHYKPSVDAGLIQGRKVAANILGTLDLHANPVQ